MSFLDDALSPFRYFDVSLFYDEYAWLIDGLIFFSIFLGLSKYAFRKRFDSKPANAISVAFSFMLTIALLLIEARFNFNIKSFGGLAVGTILVLTGFFMFSLARSANLGKVSSFCLTYFLIYSSLASINPNLFDFIATKARFINGILGLLWLVCIFMLVKDIAKFFTNRHRKDLLDKPIKDDIHIEEKEIAVVKDLKRKITDFSDIETALHAIISIIEQNDNLTPSDIERISRYLNVISRKESIFRADCDRAIIGLKKLGNIDKQRLQRLIAELPAVSDDLKKQKETEIKIEQSKINYEARILQIQQDLNNQIQIFNRHITASYNKIKVSKRETLTYLTNAKSCLKIIRSHIHEIRRLERELIDLHKFQKDTLKTERKTRRRR